MTYRDVTLSPDDIEWEWADDYDGLKSIVFDDDQFADFVDQHGLEIALEKVHRFFRAIANQLIERGVSKLDTSWKNRAVRLSRAIKRRRAALVRAYRDAHGEADMQRFTTALALKYPRAVFGSYYATRDQEA